MDSVLPQSASAQFEDLYPRLDVNTRFCIVGGGPSGLSAAYALVKLGYKNVTVFEKSNHVAGMCETVDIEGFAYDLGGQVVAKDSAPTILSLADDLQVEMENMSNHKLAMIDCTTKEYKNLNVAEDYISMMPFTIELQGQAQESGKFGVHAVASLASDVSTVFMAEKTSISNGVPLSVSTGYTASGYGFVEDMPYAYLHEFTRTSMLGKIRRIKGGYGNLWKKLAKRLPHVRTNTEVTEIHREGQDIKVVAKTHGTELTAHQLQDQMLRMEFDVLIISGALPYVGRNPTYRSSPSDAYTSDTTKPTFMMNFSEEEEELFSKVRTIEYYTTLLKVSGLNLPQGFYYCKKYVEDPSTIGHPVALQCFHAETDIYLFWSYGNAQTNHQKVIELLYEDVRQMGGKVERFFLQRKWDYFPHVSSKDMKAGFYDKMEGLQGKMNTFYVGGLLAFELTERNAAYSMNLVAKHFGTKSRNHRHVKRLFDLPLQVEETPYAVEELPELAGVEFPNLSSLDGYLRFWAKHPVVGSQVVYTWLNEEGKETEKLTYAELDSQASLICQHLHTHTPTIDHGDRVLLIHPPGLEFIVAFLGCLRARVLPVPLIPPDPMQPPGQALAKLANVAHITNSKAILTTSSYHNSVSLNSFKYTLSRKASTPRWPKLPWLHTDSWISEKAGKGFLSRVLLKNIVSPSLRDSSSGDLRKPPLSPKSPCKPTYSRIMSNKFDNYCPPNATETSAQVEMNYQHQNGEGEESEIETKPPNPDDLCFLQFTSGSTGDAKGVMITHGGLIHNVKLMRSVYKSTSQTVLVSWLPQYHDMGLIGGLFTAMVSGATAILFSPMTFIRKPTLWLDTMTRYKATHSAGPNFAFELLVRRCRMDQAAGRHLPYDLSSLRFLMISAEPIQHKTVKSFLETLHPCGLKEQTIAPGYGLAENCVFVCCAWGARQPITLDGERRVCCGYIEPGNIDMDIRIVDPHSSHECCEGEEGEVWISSPSSGAGYWGQPQKGAEVFDNILQHTQRRYLKTGDLGRVIGKKLFITGRLKELIIVQGRNVYPADIEKTVQDCCDIVRPGCCAVFGAPQETLESMGLSTVYSSDGMGVVVVAEVKNGSMVDSEVIEQIKAAVAQEHGVEVACVTLIKPRSISKTTSGKIRRLECMKQFSDRQLQVVADSASLQNSPRLSHSCPPSPLLTSKRIRKSLSFSSTSSSTQLAATAKASKQGLQTFLTNLIAERVAVHPSRICPSDDLSSFGLNSTAVVWAAQKLSEFLGVHIAAIDIYTAGSIDELCNIALSLASKNTTKANITQDHASVGGPTREEIENFLVNLIVEKTGMHHKDVSVTEPLTNYGINSVGVVFAAQKLSSFLGAHVAAIDIYTCSCIKELVDFSESMINKGYAAKTMDAALPTSTPVDSTEELEDDIVANTDMESILFPSVTRRFFITILQLLGIVYASGILLLPAVAVCSILVRLASWGTVPWLTVAVSMLPIANMAYTAAVGSAIAFLARPFLQPNYTRDPCLPLWTVKFVKWWTLHRLQDFATSTVATRLRGTIFILWWFRAMGAEVGQDVLLDTTDICEPSMIRISKGATVAEGATLQGHNVKEGLVHFRPITIGSFSWMGPFSMATIGARIPPGAEVHSLHMANTHRKYHHMPTREGQMKLKGVLSASLAVRQLMGMYLVSLVPAVSAVLAYPAFLWLGTKICCLPTKDSLFQPSILDSKAACLFLPLAATFPWHVSLLAPIMVFHGDIGILLQSIIMLTTDGKALALATCFAGVYVTYGFILCAITCILKWVLVGKLKPNDDLPVSSNQGFRMWVVHCLITSTHVNFTMFLSGTEALCVYLRSMGAKVGYFASIRSVNPLVDPDLLDFSQRCHLGDFAKIITTMVNTRGTFSSQKVSIGANSVVGAQSVVVPGTVLEKDVLLGAMSTTTKGSILREGGVYVGIQNNAMVNQQHLLRETSMAVKTQHLSQQMEPSYKKIVANLAAHIATTTMKVQTRYFHRIGVTGRGTMKVLEELPEGIPDHDIFSPGKSFTVIVRHSNSLSSDDDARGDARGAALRILTQSDDKNNVEDALIDLTLKSGKAFYARTISDFLSWLMGSREQRIQAAKRTPHVAAAVWMSLRRPDSYAELHYYSNTCCLLRSSDSRKKDHYVRFCLRPDDPQFGEDEGRVEPQDILPPDTGMLPRDRDDNRPLLFLADDFRKRLLSSGGVTYMLQIQLRPVSSNSEQNEIALDCTIPWDEKIYPFKDVASIYLDEVLDSELAEKLRFDPMNKVHSVDMVPAKSASESASVEHGRYLAYAVAQHLRNGIPLREDWITMLSEVELGKQLLKDCSQHSPSSSSSSHPSSSFGCPVLGAASTFRKDSSELNPSQAKDEDAPDLTFRKESNGKLELDSLHIPEKEGLQFLRLAVYRGVQPLMQTMVPIVFLMAAMYPSTLLLSYIGSRKGKEWMMYALLPMAYILSGSLLSCMSILCRWALVGRTRPGETSELWGLRSLCDTTWQALHALLCATFLDLTKGSLLCILYLNGLGASISIQGVYMDTLHVLNPDLLNVGPGSCIGRNALLFGHLYEGGRVLFKNVELGPVISVGARSLLLPGVKMEANAHLQPLGLAMKDEVIGHY